MKSASWRKVLGFPTGARPTDSAIRARHRELIRAEHPDAHGTHDRAAAINAARDEALGIGAFAGEFEYDRPVRAHNRSKENA